MADGVKARFIREFSAESVRWANGHASEQKPLLVSRVFRAELEAMSRATGVPLSPHVKALDG